MKRFDFDCDGHLDGSYLGDYILFADHDAAIKELRLALHERDGQLRAQQLLTCQTHVGKETAIKQAVADEREAIAQYIEDQGTVTAGTEDVYYIVDDDLDIIRQRGEK